MVGGRRIAHAEWMMRNREMVIYSKDGGEEISRQLGEGYNNHGK
jgi:hypothetical protein